MKIETLVAFTTAVELGSIHAAAKRLGVTQPTLSKNVKQLERELGSELLHRGATGIKPTQAGKLLHQRANIMIHEWRRLNQDLGEMDGALRGRVNVNLAPAAVTCVGPVAIDAFQRAHPQVAVVLSELLPPQVFEVLRDGSLDVAITPVTQELSRQDFAVHRLMSVDMCVLARRAHPLAGCDDLAGLVDARWVRLGSEHGQSVFLDRAFREAGLPSPRPMVTCQTATGALSLLRRGDYLAMMPRHVCNDLIRDDSLVELSLRSPLPVNNISLIHSALRPPTRAAQALIEQLRLTAQHEMQGKG